MGRRGRKARRAKAPEPQPVDLMAPEQLEEVYERLVAVSRTAQLGGEHYLQAAATRGHLALRRTRALREAWA